MKVILQGLDIMMNYRCLFSSKRRGVTKTRVFA